MYKVAREIAEKELGRLALAVLEGLHDADYWGPAVTSEAIGTLQKIQDVLNNESLSDFECVEEIVVILGCAGITTSRHDFG